MQSEMIQNQLVAGEWQAEVVNHEGDGEVYVTIFSGPDAEVRAKEYCFRTTAVTRFPSGSGQDFFANSSIKDLARIQGVGPLKDRRVLWGGIPEDEDVEKFVREIYDARR
jgi:hypothetical protein